MLEKKKQPVLTLPTINQSIEDPWNKLIINLDALKWNYKYLKSTLPEDTILYAVLKSDAYGHGLKETGTVLHNAGCNHFAVEAPQDGITLRNEGIEGEIMLMNPIPIWMSEIAVRYDLSVTVIHHSILKPLNEIAGSMNKKCKIHFNINLGLNRMGIPSSKITQVVKEASNLDNLVLEGMYGQPRDIDSAIDAYKKLNKEKEKLQSKGFEINTIHFANSINFLTYPETHISGVRIGILLYGILPTEKYKKGSRQFPIKPVMSIETEIVQMLELNAGSKIGYHSNKKLKRDSRIATLPIGYYHGLNRNLSKNGYVLIYGKKVKFIGSISMNAAMVDVTDIPGVKIGDKAIILGNQGDQEININEIAQKSNTIAAELLTNFGQSITRHFNLTEEEVTSVTKIEQPTESDIIIQYIQREQDLPEWIQVYELVQFIQDNMEYNIDSEEIIMSIIDFCLSNYQDGDGFIIIASIEEKLVGMVACSQFDTINYLPKFRLNYLCVHSDHRGKKIGTRMLNETLSCANGSMAVIIHKDNPSVKFFQAFNFDIQYYQLNKI